MANKTGVTPAKLYGVGARGVSEGSKPGPKVSPPTFIPTGNPPALSATNMQGNTKGAKGLKVVDD